MKPFQLKIVTPDGVAYDGQAEELIVRTTTGDMGFLAGHLDAVAPLGMGQAMVMIDGQKRYAACIGGMVSVTKGTVNLVPTTFEWAENIDVTRAEASKTRAQKVLKDKNATATELTMAEARLKRALVRTGVATYKPK